MWRADRRHVHVSREYRRWRQSAAAMIRAACRPAPGPCCVWIRAHPPDARRRDLDNLIAPVLDALVGGGALPDDSTRYVAGVGIVLSHAPPRGSVRVRIVPRGVRHDVATATLY